MELIHNLEPLPREAFGGVVTCVDFGGNLDSWSISEVVAHAGKYSYAYAGASVSTGSTPGSVVRETDVEGARLVGVATGKTRP
jgi:anthranilate/para-aminobenzoate synthase component I